MLSRLSIQNYAIIDELEIDFSGRLNIITGETGAGKSIIMGALGLILGERADMSALVNKAKKCVIEGSFQSGNKKNIRQFLKTHELDGDEEVVVRREIGANGKSRAFINDTPVNLSQLGELSSLLVDLHQQFDTLELGQADFQRDVLDALAGNGSLLDSYHTEYTQWVQLKRETTGLKDQQVQFNKEADYNRFQYSELEEAAFKENELEETDATLKMLSHAEGIKQALNKTYFELKESESPLVQQLKVLLQHLQPFHTYHPDLPMLLERLQSAQIELQDIADDVDRISDHVNYDPEKIEQLNERLSLGYKLQKKHGVNSTSELLEVQRTLEEKLQAVLNIEETIQQKEKALADSFANLSKLAEKISAARRKQIKPLEEKVNKLLAQVGMPNAQLKTAMQTGEPGPAGHDTVEFLFDANKSGQFQPVRKVASGGELSRLMLCIKSLVARSIDLPTLIFDEIDTGISGEAARQVGIILKELAAQRQVICITHQPQIAGKADAHFFVYKEIVKESGKDTVKTNIRQLSTDERIITIAKMLSGEKPTAAAMENAKEMIVNIAPERVLAPLLWGF
ncbi:MAG: DNA repair protein RecN [Bacteroidetes bacterium]|nr:DNA repair protein RecN [Bacteroidota bacterium]